MLALVPRPSADAAAEANKHVQKPSAFLLHNGCSPTSPDKNYSLAWAVPDSVVCELALPPKPTADIAADAKCDAVPVLKDLLPRKEWVKPPSGWLGIREGSSLSD